MNSSTRDTVNMVRTLAASGGDDRFCCSLYAWELMLELGTVFGWKPQGTSYAPGDYSSVPHNPTRHDYQPGEQQDSKLIMATDALQWATALGEARSSPHLPALMGDQPDAVATTSGITAFETTLGEFITYALGGAFAFSRSAPSG